MNSVAPENPQTESRSIEGELLHGLSYLESEAREAKLHDLADIIRGSNSAISERARIKGLGVLRDDEFEDG